MNRKMKNTWITKKARYIISLAMVLTLVLQFATPLITFNASAADYPGIVGQTMIVPSTITNQGSYASYNVTGTLEGGVPFSRETFCTHSEFGGGGSAPFVYYWNSDPGETATSNPLFWHNVLGDGGALNDGISMTVEQWRDLRYLILLTRANKWSEGQLVYWAYLGHYMPQKYGSLGASAGKSGVTWSDELLKYFGTTASSDFYGLGPVTAGQTLDLGAEADVIFKYYDGSAWVDITDAATAGTFDSDGGTDTAMRVGPFRVEWKPGSSAALAQLNSGVDRNTPPTFNLGAALPTDSNRVRFYKGAATDVPTTSVKLGEEFYIEYNVTDKNLAAAYNAGGTHTIAVPVTATPKGTIVGKIIADEFFISAKGQNQVNVLTENRTPRYVVNLKFKSTEDPGLPETPVGDIVYERPEVDKVVAEDNHLDNTGDYVDVLPVKVGTDVIHQLTVTSNDPKGTILTFQNTDYDLYPSALDLRKPGDPPTPAAPETTALVHTAAEFKAAIDDNKDIKLMNDVVLPSTWTASERVYSGIFDGNGYRLKGDDGIMTDSVFRKTDNAVFYRVQFVDFQMTRTVESDNNTDTYLRNTRIGSLVDFFDSSENKARFIDVFVSGSLTLNFPTRAGDGAYAGGVAGQVIAEEIYGVKALLNFTITNANINNYEGGMFGAASTKVFENNELMAGSNFTASSRWVGGFALTLNNASPTVVRNCRAEFTYNNTAADGGNQEFGGLFARTSTSLTEVDRCHVNITYNRTTAINWFGGLLAHQDTSNANITISNSSAVYNGVVTINNANDTGAGAGIMRDSTRTDQERNITIKNCYANVPMKTTNGATAAGIYNYAFYDNNNNGRNITIENCIAAGDITVDTSSGTVAGIAIGGSRAEYSGSSITKSIAAMNIRTTRETTAARVGGIWAVPASKDGLLRIALDSNLFAGAVDAAFTNVKQIFNGTTVTSAANNYTATAGFADATGADGQTTSALSAAGTALTFYDQTLGLDITDDVNENWGKTEEADVIWSLDDTTAPFVPRLNTLYRWPVQRIYVNDYYNAKNTQEFMQRLYVWENGAFKHIWESNRVEVGASNAEGAANIDMRITNADHTYAHEFVFYYFKPADDGGGENDGAKQPGVWQNQVKITPRDNYLVEDGGGGSYHYDWPGDDDDDWVLAEEAPVVVKLNIVKMASVSGNPSPLGGATFTLYKSESVYSDFTGIDYTTGSGWSVAGTVQPEGYTGATFTSPITTGSYVLKETVVPANYVDAHNTWYIVYSGGELRVYLNDPTLNENARVALSENPTSGTLTYSATIGNVRDESTLARIRVVKYNENGSQTITGVDEWIDGNHHEYGERFTGAVYGLWKFAGSSFTGDKFVYGSTIICNGTDNFSDIEPGYYELAEIKAPDGYAIDPTPIRIVFNGTTITVTDTHGNSDQVGYLDGDQTLEATIGAQTTDGGKPAVTIGTKDKKTEYELTLRKLDGDAYDIDSEVPLVDVSFELYDTGTVPALKATAVTGIDGYATIKFPRENGDYTIKEVLPSGLSGLYTPAADYEIRIRDNELFVSGGPFGYDFKIVSGQRDGESYVILDPDGAATPVEPGDSGFPEGLTVPDHGIIGLIRASAEVPNYENQNPPDPTRLYVQKVYVTTDGDEVFIVQVSGDFSDTEATSKYIVFTKDGAGSTTGLPTLTGGAVYEGPYAWVASSAATGKAEVTGVKAGEVYTITEWVFDSAIDDEALLDASEYYTVTGEGPTAGLPATGDTTVVIDNVKIVVLTTSATINGIKAINGAPNSTKQFSFTLTQVDNADGDAFTGVTPYTATATVNGADSFSFTLADLGPGTYFYKVTEDGSGGSGWTYASAQYIVKVEVGAAPGLGVTYTYHEVVSDTASSTATFTNSYAATGSITLQAKKAIVGSAPALEDYDFAVYAGTDTTGSLVATGTSIGDGSITFTPAIEYTVADVGLHYYTIAETTPPDAGWTAPAAQTVTVNVIDNGDGTLTATYGSTPPTFTNTYNVTGTASAALTAKKTVTGAELTNGQFSFGLYNSNDTHTLVGSLIEEVTNDGGGNITFASLPYTAAGVHHYVIKELSASGNGWTVDASVYGVTVTVADDGEGGIEATVSYSTTTPPTFENVYAATGSVTLAAKKVISGTSAAFDGYDFAVYAGTDTTVAPVATGTSLADGSIVFAPAITYNAAGTYTYTIKETSTLGTGWTAPAAQTVTVNVVDNNDGTLTATPTYETPPTFTNTYNPPYVPPTPTPPTPTPTETPTPTPTPEETPTPTPTPSETPTPTPRVPVTPTPPVPPNDEGSYVEFDDDGSPLGEWHYDEDSGEWIFDEFPPLGAIDTGDGAIIPIALVALLVSAMGIFVLKPKKKK